MLMLRRLLFLLVLTLAAASAATAGPAKLTLMSSTQFAVRGSTFHPREHVLVVVSAKGEHASKRIAAGPAGGFVARFPTVDLPSCAAFIIRATGDEGSHAALKVVPECPQPATP
jgi:hypothetical protein